MICTLYILRNMHILQKVKRLLYSIQKSNTHSEKTQKIILKAVENLTVIALKLLGPDFPLFVHHSR